MKLHCRNKKYYFTRIFVYERFLLFLSLLISGLVFLSYPALIKEALASNEKNKTYLLKTGLPTMIVAASQSTPEDEACEVKGIFYEEENPRVLINEDLLSVNDYCCGAKISGIFAEYVVLEFPSGKREYKLGDVFRREKASTKPVITSPTTITTQSSYLTSANSLVENLMAIHSQHSATLNMPLKQSSLFTSPDEATEIRVRANKMLALIQEKRQDFGRLSAPDNAKRHHSLTVKLFDIAEEGWKAVLSNNKDKAEVFFDRLSKIAQEISRESVSMLSRQ